MQQLLGDKLASTADDNSFLRELFLQRLPSHVRMVLASADATTELGKLAEMADKVMEVTAPSVAAIQEKPPKPPTTQHATLPASEVKQLREEVARLTSLVESLATHSCRRSSSRFRRRSPSPAAPTNKSPGTLCWYHRKFGKEAKKCHDPCMWASNPEASN